MLFACEKIWRSTSSGVRGPKRGVMIQELPSINIKTLVEHCVSRPGMTSPSSPIPGFDWTSPTPGLYLWAAMTQHHLRHSSGVKHVTFDRPALSPIRYINSVVFVIKLVNTGSYSTTLFSSVLFDFVVIIYVWVVFSFWLRIVRLWAVGWLWSVRAPTLPWTLQEELLYARGKVYREFLLWKPVPPITWRYI